MFRAYEKKVGKLIRRCDINRVQTEKSAIFFKFQEPLQILI